jgi:hypothetical protein
MKVNKEVTTWRGATHGGEMGAGLIDCRRDKQFCAFESAAGSSVRALGLSTKESL